MSSRRTRSHEKICSSSAGETASHRSVRPYSQAISPMIRATPLLSVLTDDLGILRPGEACGCGIASPTLEILGRAGMDEIRTCAAGAEELLKEGKNKL